MKINRLVLFVVLICTTFALNAQEQHRIEDKGAVVGVKTNIPYWGTATFNAEVEVRLAKKWTLELEAGLNPFDGKKDDGSYGRSLKHLRLHPELRYWFCESFHKHFLGLHIPYLLYNVSDVKLLGVENERSQGWGTGVGFSYGYQWLLSKHWNLEATVGVGYLYLDYDKYPCANCGSKIESGHKHYFGPTQAAISIMYLF
ncbi:DUF3575 domain-containing protein [Parabacteroides johnsonii]|jgi:hypothetical protein|uniref:DUF3575 domain-containing protein n=1 Tax=Parabacteroides johnsonii TaxID=387661 RepID=UPI001C8BAC75|nr:DUF3575 domain-containing protein [Parabacteroides johnsonii]MBX9108398.1 DUF3575 domain-containing protein [Parabacteroides johnsonii]